ncbi:EAL domain-containing protein [Thiolapillus sp.]|uniref:EAL domain-containing protein n=1 Tax=Thiolapillus sp. TaxID=2017437 RepID=UPI003AF89599
MTQNIQEQNIKLMRLMKQAIDDNLLVPGFHPLLQTHFPSRKTYLLSCNLKTATGQIIPYKSLRKLATMADMGAALDRWMVKTGLQTLKRMHLEQPEANIIIPQSASSLHNREYPRWLDRQSSREDVSIRGLIISFRLSQIAKNLKLSSECISGLHQLEINTMIDSFTTHPAALKILKAMGSRYMSAAPALLKENDDTIKRIINTCHRHSILILLPGINRAEDVNLCWFFGADLLEGNYIHPPAEDTDFSFSPVIV